MVDPGASSTQASRRVSPWVRALIPVAVIGPALALGGVWPGTIPVFAAVVAGALVATRGRRDRPLRLPIAAGIGLFAAAITALQVLPIPGLRELLAPSLHAWVALAREGVTVDGWPSLSPTPSDTALELVRLLSLTGLVIVCAQRSWRRTALAVTVVGSAVALIGLVQHGLHLDRIYGVYEARHTDLGDSPALLSTFVSANHQSGLLLLGVFTTAGLALDARLRLRRIEQRGALLIALLLQVSALVLSMSRGALLSGAAVGVIAMAVAWWPEAPGRASLSDRHGRSRLAGLAVLGGVVIGLGSLGAWHELSTLLQSESLDAPTAMRLRVTAGSLGLLDLSPVAGIGRGAFGDVFSAFDPEPSHVWFSHLECAPLTMLLEWGLVLGGAMVVALPAWWLHTVRDTGRHDDARARRVVLLGLLALAVQNLADFSLEFLGVAAPACALAGALSPAVRRVRAPSRLRWSGVGLAGLAMIATAWLPMSWASISTAATVPSDEAAIAARPLHAAFHRAHAREALAQGSIETADARAHAAVRLQPGHIDGWLLLAGVAHARGDREAEHRALRGALERLHAPATEALVDHLIARVPDPDALAPLAPVDDLAYDFLMRGLLAHAPRHADAVAALRSDKRPDDPEPLRQRVEAALQLGQPELALHHARLWRQLAPRSGHAHLAVARALQAHDRLRDADLREALERALVEADLGDPTLRGLVEEQLLRVLLRSSDPADGRRARALAGDLRTRPANEEVRRRRAPLIDAAQEHGRR